MTTCRTPPRTGSAFNDFPAMKPKARLLPGLQPLIVVPWLINLVAVAANAMDVATATLDDHRAHEPLVKRCL